MHDFLHGKGGLIEVGKELKCDQDQCPQDGCVIRKANQIFKKSTNFLWVLLTEKSMARSIYPTISWAMKTGRGTEMNHMSEGVNAVFNLVLLLLASHIWTVVFPFLATVNGEAPLAMMWIGGNLLVMCVADERITERPSIELLVPYFFLTPVYVFYYLGEYFASLMD